MKALLDRFDRAVDKVRDSIERLPDDELSRTMASGWTPQEMLGHLAFWMECSKPVVVGILRGDAEAISGWRFGSGYVADGTEPWPVDAVHNAREGRWAGEQSRAAVIERLENAGQIVRSVIRSLSAVEEQDPKFLDYLENAILHVEEHGRELAAAKDVT